MSKHHSNIVITLDWGKDEMQDELDVSLVLRSMADTIEEHGVDELDFYNLDDTEVIGSVTIQEIIE